jgi:hypothetical protein
LTSLYCAVEVLSLRKTTPFCQGSLLRCRSTCGAGVASSTAITGAVLRFLTFSVSDARLIPSRKLNLSEYFEEHFSHSQKKTVACDGFKLQMAFGTSLQGVVGCLISNRYKRPPLQVMKRQPTVRAGTVRNHDNDSCEQWKNGSSSIWRLLFHSRNGTTVLSR